jgi:hypothetical protein
MLANIKGLVDRLEISQAKAMIPLFEAISNAIDAIEEHRDGFSSHSFRIRLIATHDLAHRGGDEVLVLDGFDVSDDSNPPTNRYARLVHKCPNISSAPDD